MHQHHNNQTQASNTNIPTPFHHHNNLHNYNNNNSSSDRQPRRKDTDPQTRSMSIPRNLGGKPLQKCRSDNSLTRYTGNMRAVYGGHF